MSELGKCFEIKLSDAISNPKAIFKGQNYRITILTERLVRFEYDETGVFENQPTELAIFRNFSVPAFDVKEDNKELQITTKYFKLNYQKGKPFIGTKLSPDAYLKVSLLKTDKLWYFNHPEARNFLSTGVSLDESSGRAKYVKGLYSTDGFAAIDDSKNLVFDESGVLRQRDVQKIDTYLFMYRRDFGFCLKDYFTLTGNPPLLPRYALGIWWNKNERYHFLELKELLKQFNRHNIPLSVLLLGENWHLKDETDLTKYKTGFTFDEKIIPNPSEFIKYMNERGVRVGININPIEGVMTHEKNYERFATSLGQVEKQTIPFNVFDKFIVKAYFDNLINPLLDLGVDLLWLDYYNQNNISSLRALSYYHIKNSCRDKKQRPIIMARSGAVAAHRYPIHYSGQTIVNWKTLELLPFYNSTSSNMGISWWSHDIGGYKDGVEDNELYSRYVQLGTFSPIFRFSSKEGKYYKREPWKWDVKTRKIVEDYCNLRHRLIPYLYTEAYKYHKTGLPIVQPLYYRYPEIYDEPAYKNEYYLGSELFIAPITSKKDLVMNRAVHRVFLPDGMWYDFKTGKKFPGNKRYVLFYKDEDYPVFAKAGSIIPLAELEKNKNVTNAPKNMEIHVFPGLSNIYNLYEDDGVSSLYKDGYYITTKVEYNYLANNYTMILRPMEGKSGIIPDLRNYKIRFRNVRSAEEVIAYVGEDSAEVNTYEEDTDFIVEVKNVLTTKQLTINCKGKDIEIDAVRLINDDIDSIITELKIETRLKEKISAIIFGKLPMNKKRIEIRKLKRDGLEPIFIRMFIKLLEYVAEI